MLRDSDYARQLDADLDTIGNDQAALDKLNAALDRMPDFDSFDSDETWQPSSDDWDDYEQYLDRLDMMRETTPMTPPRLQAWLSRTQLDD